MSIKLKGSTDGSVTLQAPADTSPTGTDKTLILPTSAGSADQVLVTDGSGTLSWDSRMTAAGPAFSAGGTTQSLAPSTDTKVVLGTEGFDTANCYDTSTSRFTPNVAGYYFVSGEAQYVGSNSAGKLFILKFNKSGTFQELGVTRDLDQYMRLNIQFLYYMNGTTDYLEFYVHQSDSVYRNIGSTFFQAFLARPA